MASISHEEHAEHAEHAAQHGNKNAALLIAVLAAGLAICEQQGKHAEIAVEANAVLAADTWNEYQAKSVRSAIAQDLERMIGTLDQPAQPELAVQRKAVIKQLRDDRMHYDNDPKTGKRRWPPARAATRRCATIRWSVRTPTTTPRRRSNSASCCRPPR